MVKLADTLDLGSSAVRCKGSSPFSRIFGKSGVYNKKWIGKCESSSAVELHLAKVDVEGSIPFSRSFIL